MSRSLVLSESGQNNRVSAWSLNCLENLFSLPYPRQGGEVEKPFLEQGVVLV